MASDTGSRRAEPAAASRNDPDDGHPPADIPTAAQRRNAFHAAALSHRECPTVPTFERDSCPYVLGKPSSARMWSQGSQPAPSPASSTPRRRWGLGAGQGAARGRRRRSPGSATSALSPEAMSTRNKV